MSIIKRNTSTILGLDTQLQALTVGVGSANSSIGDLEELQTTDQTTLVGAINEVASSAGEGDLQSDQNLADLGDAGTARNNLDVYSRGEVDQVVANIESGNGNNISVADLDARDGLTDLTIADRVFVTDDGDGKWAIYKPTAFSDGSVTEWVKLSDQDALENATSATAIKAAYESNSDTNAFTDADQSKLDLVSATQAINLDDVLVVGDLQSDIASTEDDDLPPTTAAVRAYVDANAGSGDGPLTPVIETVTVVGSTITLTQAPAGGLGGVMNFGTVRRLVQDGDDVVAYDATISATESETEFTVQTDTADEWDGQDVQIQYLH